MPSDAGDDPEACKDYQEIKVQEQVTKLEIGTIPRSITVILEDDLVDTCKPGDDVLIVYVERFLVFFCFCLFIIILHL